MKYLNTNNYNPPNLPKNTPVWAVAYGARMYADTYEEAVEIYNELVQKRIDKLQQMINTAQEDYIHLEAIQ